MPALYHPSSHAPGSFRAHHRTRARGRARGGGRARRRSGSDDGPLLPDLDQAAPGELSGRTLTLKGSVSVLPGLRVRRGECRRRPADRRRQPARPSASANEARPADRERGRVDGDGDGARGAPLRPLARPRALAHARLHALRATPRERQARRPDRKTGFCLGDRYKFELELGRAEPEPIYTEECGRNQPGAAELRRDLGRLRRRLRRAIWRARSSTSRVCPPAVTSSSIASTASASCRRATTRTTRRRWRSSSPGRTGRRTRRA